MNQTFLISLAAMGGIGGLFGVFLSYASKKFATQKDDRVEQAEEVLPGANCGACGYPGCSAYAEAVVLEGTAVSLCPVGGKEVAARLGEIMGVSVEDEEEPMVARVKCQGGKNCMDDFQYAGISDCYAANALHGGSKSCKYACLGLGSCVKACPFGAITINANGTAEVDEELCTACGICVKECPKAVIDLVPQSAKVHVLCKNQEKGKEVKPKCKTGCIACRLCEKACAFDAIKVQDNIAVIDYSKCTGCGACIEKCPVKAIKEVSVKEECCQSA